MERTKYYVTKYLMLLLCLHLLIFRQTDSHAATSCAAGGVTTIGLEWVADRCLPEGMNDNSTIHYINTMVQCSGSTVSLFAPYGDTLGTPTSIIDYAKAQGYRVFRNKEGSHIVMVHKYFTGLIDGKSMSGYQTGQVYTDVFKEAFILPTPTPDCKGGDFNLCPFEQKGRSTVNMGTGRLSHTQHLFGTQSTQPLALDLYLNYRSLQFAPSAIGNGWSHSYEMPLAKESNGSRIFWLDGKRRIYTWTGSSYLSPRGDYSSLIQNTDSTYTIREKNGTRRNFNSDGSPASIVDRNGNAVVFAYSSGRLTTVTDPNGRSISFTYDSSGKLSSVTDPGNNTYIFSYANGYLSGIAHPDGGVWQYGYGANGLMAQKTDPEQNTVNYVYDSDKRVVSTADPAGGVLSYAPPPIATAGKVPDPYPENRLPVKVFVFKEKGDAGWTYTYDTRSERIRTKTDPLGNVTSYTYDVSGNVLSETVTGIGTTSYSYDSKGNILSVTNPLGDVTKYTYNGFGEVMTIDGAPGKTANIYDTKGNLISTTDAVGAVTAYSYDDRGNIISVTDPLNKVTALKYDNANNMVSVTLPTNAVTQLSYDRSGNLLSVTDATGGLTRFAYDSRNNLVSSTDPLNNTTSYAYDKNGNRALKTDANSNMTAYKHDFLGQVTSITNALQYATRFTYGAPGCAACSGTDRLTELVDPKNQKTSWTYDRSGRVVSETDPLGKMTAYEYGVGEAPSSRMDANGATIHYSYDALQRLVGKTYPDGTSESYTYDARGNVLTAVNKDVSYTFTYDPGNRIKTVRDNRGYAIDYEYDLGGNRIKMVVQPGMADERVTQYSYDDGGRLAAMITPAGVFAFGYDLANRRTSLSYPNATVAGYGYDAAGRLVNITHKSQDGATIASASYTYDKVGNRLTKGGTVSESYRYDVIDQLLRSTAGAAIEIFSYDAVGNRLSGPSRSKDASYEHDAANRMLKGRQYLYSYDENGNQLSKTLPADSSKGWTYTWDYENRLGKAERTGGGGARTVTFKYDPFGRRIEKKVVTEVNGTTEMATWQYVHDSSDVAMELKDDGASTTVTSYDHAPGIDDHLAMERAGRFYFYHADGLGSVVSITDNDRRVVQSYTYESFGLQRPSTNFENSYTFSGRAWEKEMGLHYYRARYYDAIEGRFITMDPVGLYGGDVNLYRYVKNNPIIFTDPSGNFLKYGNYCGPGHSDGPPIDDLDALCEAHDRCYTAEGFCWKDVIQPPRDGSKYNKQHECDVALREGARKVVPTNDKMKKAREWVLKIF